MGRRIYKVAACGTGLLHERSSNLASQRKKYGRPERDDRILELLARFELATSSLPTILEAVLPCVSYRKLLNKTLVYQRLFGFAYRCLL